jgi:carbonic anhydrase
MTSEIQKNLVEKNAEYVRTFDKGDLALPPAKKYLVGKKTPVSLSISSCIQPLEEEGE